MQHNRITIRRATPRDAGPVAELIDLAALAHAPRTALELVFPGTVRERLEKLEWLFLNEEQNVNHFSRFFVAEVAGRVAASMCTNTRESNSILVWRRALRGMGFTYGEMGAMAWRLRPYMKVKPHFTKDSLIVDNVATFPEFRGLGAARSLLETAVRRAGEGGYPRLELECQVGNDAALRIYEGAGFRVTEVRTHPSWERALGTPGVLRMTLEL